MIDMPGFIRDRSHALSRAEIIWTILRELREARYFDQLGKSLDVGSSCGQGCYALREGGANPVYGLEPDDEATIRAVQWGLLDITKVLPASLEDLPGAYENGFFGPEPFDTVTSFMAPFLDVDFGPDRYDDPATKKAAERMVNLLKVLGSLLPYNETPEEKISGSLEQMLPVLAPTGRIILTAGINEAAPRVFDRLGLNYQTHQLVTRGPESVAYIVSRR